MSQLSPVRFTACLPHWLGGAIAVSTVIGLGTAPATAQIMPDSTLGTESSVVNPGGIVPGGPGILIEGGAARGGNLFHSFNEFNVNNGQRVYFADPAAIENILTRVTGENGSLIDGVLGVDGLANLYFLNPNGVIFGPNAQLDIPGSFVTSTGNSFSFADGSEFSALPTAGEALTVSVPLGVQFNDQAQGEIQQRGSLEVGAGESLTLFGDTVTVQGELTAPGGTVEVLGDVVTMGDTAAVDVSSATGGGTVLIGGDYKGEGTVPNAQQTTVVPGATIEANALESGDGGRVIVWADGTTKFGGSIEAKGGPLGGDGGFAEVSGKETLRFIGTVDLSAPQGVIGTLLLDPKNITVTDSAINTPGDLDINEFTDQPGVDSTITNATINAATANVVLQATENITIDGAINIAAANVGLTAQANNDIVVNKSITTQNGNVSLLADNDSSGEGSVDINAGINTQGGNITLNGNSATKIAVATDVVTIESGGGDIKITGSGVGVGGISVASTTNSDGGNITFNGTATGGLFNNGVEIQGPITSQSGPINLTGTSNVNTGITVFTNITSDTGIITLDGTTAGTTVFADGIDIIGAITSQSGAIDLEGESAGGDGISIRGAITSSGGTINLTGNSSSSGSNGIDSSGSINSGGGNIIVAGTSSGGIGISGRAASGGGDIQFTGTSTSGAGISGSDATSSGGDINFTGNSTTGVGLDTVDATFNSGGGDINLTGNSIEGEDHLSSDLDVFTSGKGDITFSGDLTFQSSSFGDISTQGTIDTTNSRITLADDVELDLEAGTALNLGALILNGTSGDVFLTAPVATITQSYSTPGGRSITDGDVTTVNVASTGSVQAAIEAVGTGGTVNLAAATYQEDLNTNDNDQFSLIGQGAGFTILDGSGAFPVIFLTFSNNLDVTFSNLTIQNGVPNAIAGAGISAVGLTDSKVTVTDSVITSNSGFNGLQRAGAGIAFGGTGSELTINNSIISNNENAFDGGGISNNGGTVTINNSTISGNSATNQGGGIYNFAGTLTLNNSTVANNTAAQGGGILATNNSLTVNTSTIANNTATQNGGGIAVTNNGILTVNNSTLSGNNAPQGNGGGFFVESGTVDVGSSLVTNNTAQSGDNVFRSGGTFDSNGNNLFGANSTAGFVGATLVATDIVPTVTVAQILNTTLANYGGSTNTLGLVPNSPALDAGSGASADQRGIAVVNGVRDIGAFESQGYTFTSVSGDRQFAVINEAFPEPLVVTVSSAFSEPVAGGRVFFTAPTSGASAILSGNTPIIDANGQASVTATANGITGIYSVTAEVNPTVEFRFVNLFSLPDPSGFIIARATGGELEIPVDDSDILFNLGQDPVGVTGPLALTLSESEIIALQSACSPGGGEGSGALVFTGSGGLPPGPNNPQVDEAIDIPWVEPDSGPAAPVAPTEADQSDALIDSQVMVVDGDGAVHFVASATPQTLQSFGVSGAELCRAISSP